MKSGENCRLEMVSAKRIRRMPEFKTDTSPKRIGKIRDFARERGFCLPVILSESSGCMPLLAGAASFEICLEEKMAKIPAVIVQTADDADSLMFALQSAQLDDSPGAIAVSVALVQMIDVHGVPRKHIAESLGKSPAWMNRMESLSRKLNATVQSLVTQGHVSARSAQEIARLPDDVQTPFAIAAGNAFLSKENITYLVNRYLDGDVSEEERSRIIHTPTLTLPNERKKRGRTSRDCSDSARLSRAVARCMDDVLYLSRLLNRIDRDETTVHMSDVTALSDSLSALSRQILAVFYPGKNTDGDGS
jgi:ParB-like chromosome segregation protein Spo0J